MHCSIATLEKKTNEITNLESIITQNILEKAESIRINTKKKSYLYISLQPLISPAMSRSTAFRFSLNDNLLTKEGRYKVGGTGIVVLIVILNKIHLDSINIFRLAKYTGCYDTKAKSLL